MRRLDAATLEAWARALLEGGGLVPGAAVTVAGTLVEASLRGVDSHGVNRLPVYVERIRAGLVSADPQPRVERRDGAFALMSGDGGPGSVAGVAATDLSVELAREHGVGAVAVHRSTHFGAAGHYVVRAARAGMVALATTNAEPYVVAYGGAGRALGTNPIAVAAPTEGDPWVFDMATSQVAVGKVIVAANEGRPIPPGWGVDAQGAGTTDPARVEAMVPLGGYKGYGLAVVAELLSGVLSGAGVRDSIGRMYDDWDRPQDVGHFHLALDPERTVGRAAFAAGMQALIGGLRAMPPGPGHDAVLVAGDPEDRVQAERGRDGIPLSDELWSDLERLSGVLRVEPPPALGA